MRLQLPPELRPPDIPDLSDDWLLDLMAMYAYDCANRPKVK